MNDTAKLIGKPMQEKLASIFTDTASLLIGDPCQLLKSDTNHPWTYDDMIAALGGDPGKQPRFVVLPTERGGVGGIRVRIGSDGYCPVTLEYDEAGEPVRIIIELGRVQP